MGDELVLGQVANTNAQEISRALTAAGEEVRWHTAVGDDLELIAGSLKVALARSDVVVVTGGLGPTPDDLTRAGVAAALGRPLVRDERLERGIREFFARLRREMPEDNLRQADLPEGATPIEPEGTAPGFQLEQEGVLLVALPGVPWEMRAMLDKTVLPLVRARSKGQVALSRQILVVGLGESLVHQKIADLVKDSSNPAVAYLAGGGQVRLRLTAKASDEAGALGLLQPLEDEIRARLGDAAVEGEHDSIGAALGAMLRARGKTIAAAESLTGGLIGVQLTQTPGASDYFLGSLVCYSNRAKRELAGVDPAVLEGAGAVSAEAAGALARGAVQRLGAHLGVSATGVAGPSQQDGAAVGAVYVGATLGERTEVRHVRAYGDRANVRAVAAAAALDLARRLLLAADADA